MAATSRQGKYGRLKRVITLVKKAGEREVHVQEKWRGRSS